jgi:hypothetical protein
LEAVSLVRPALDEASISAGRDDLLARLSGGALRCGRRTSCTEECEASGKQEGLSGCWCSSDNSRLTGAHDSVPVYIPAHQFGHANVNRKPDATLLLAGQEDIERSRLGDLSRTGWNFGYRV